MLARRDDPQYLVRASRPGNQMDLHFRANNTDPVSTDTIVRTLFSAVTLWHREENQRLQREVAASESVELEVTTLLARLGKDEITLSDEKARRDEHECRGKSEQSLQLRSEPNDRVERPGRIKKSEVARNSDQIVTRGTSERSANEKNDKSEQSDEKLPTNLTEGNEKNANRKNGKLGGKTAKIVKTVRFADECIRIDELLADESVARTGRTDRHD